MITSGDLYLRNEHKRSQFVSVIRSRIGCPYHWGGQGPAVFDCSGLVVWGLQQVGLLSSDTDLSALGLAGRYSKSHTPLEAPTKPGELCFYGRDVSMINHVMIVLTTWGNGRVVLCGARGGSAGTTTDEKAYSNRAYVDVVTGDYWKGRLILILDPFSMKL